MILLMLLSALCLMYYISIVLYAGFGSPFSIFWLLASIGFAGLLVFIKMNKQYHIIDKIPTAILCTLVTFILLGIFLVSMLFGMVLSGMNDKVEDEVDYVVVLGCKIKGERVTKSLAKRLDTAYDYYVENPSITLIVSGGKGPGEDITEALAMKRYLMDKGVMEDSIILEDKSINTRQNLEFTKNIILSEHSSLDEVKVAICSNNFHIFRAKKLAEGMGYPNIEAIAAPSDNRLLLNYMVRDSLAIFKEFLLGNVKIR